MDDPEYAPDHIWATFDVQHSADTRDVYAQDSPDGLVGVPVKYARCDPAPTTPTPSPDAGKAFLDEAREALTPENEVYHFGIPAKDALSILAYVSALEARALAAEGERDRMREALDNEAAELREVWRALKSVDGNQAHAILPVVWPFLQGIEGRAERLEALTPPTEGETP